MGDLNEDESNALYLRFGWRERKRDVGGDMMIRGYS